MYTIKSIENKPGSVIEISLVIPKEEIEKRWKKAVDALNDEVKLDGFRPGKIPEKVLVEKIGELAVVEEAARIALHDSYPAIIEEKNLKVLGSPQIVITKIARGSDLECTLRTATIPEVKLSDYKKIAKKVYAEKEEVEVTEKDVEAVIDDLKKYHASKEGEEKEIDLEFVKSLGDFNSIEDFKEKIKGNLKAEKEYKLKEKKRIEALTSIVKESTIDVPEILIENELDRMTTEFSHELSRIGSTLENYKKQIKKTEDELRSDWKDKAIERVKSELALMEIAKKENLKPEASEVEHESKHFAEHYPNTPKERIAVFVEEMLTKEEVFRFFEKQ